MANKKKGKIGIDSFISWGATIVIVGLMFKLQHWAWGDWMIVIGLGTEAVLFLLLGFQAIGTNSSDSEEINAPNLQVSGHTAALDSMFKNADISPEAINNLGLGLKNFSNTVGSISQVVDSTIATDEFINKIKFASIGFDKFNSAFEKATFDLANIGGSKIDTDSYNDQVQKLAKNLESLNAIYERELIESSSTLKSMNSHYESIAETLNSLNDSSYETKIFKDQVGQLNKNLASLNAVYGNMLAAMNHKAVV
jgi:gliding motility-associated protein GldL